MIHSTDDFLSFLQTNKPTQSKKPNSITSKKTVSFSNSVKFNDKVSEDGQSQVQEETKVTSDNVSRGRDEVEQRQDTFHKSLMEENSNRIHLDRTNAFKEDEQVTVNSHNLTDSQLDAVPSYTRSKAFHGLNDGLDLLFKNDMAFNNDRSPILKERNDQNSILSNDFKRKNNDLFHEKHHAMQAQPTLKSASVKMSRNDLHQQSFPRSNVTQNQMHVPLASQESIESVWKLVREETSTMIAQVMQHLDANSSLLQKIQETQSSAQAVDESIIKNDWLQELRKHTAYVEDLCKGDKQQLNQTLTRLDELLNYMNSSTREDKTRLQDELSRISKLEENLAEERKKILHSQEVERKRMMEDRVAFEQWKHKNEEELRRERESIQRRDELLTERENELNRQYADMKLNMQTLQYEKDDLEKAKNTISSQLEDIKGRRERLDIQAIANEDAANKLDQERSRLQEMAEKISETSRAVARRSREAEEVLNERNKLELERLEIKKHKTEITEQMQKMKESKMDLARQRVLYLKEKVMLSRICTQ